MELKKQILLGALLSQIFFSLAVHAADTDTPPPGPPPGGMGRGHFDDNDALLKKARESGNSDIRDFVMAQMKKGNGPQSLQDQDFRTQLQAKLDALDAKAQSPATTTKATSTTPPKKSPPPPKPTATKNHALTPDEAKKLVRGFGGVIDQENKKALLAGQIPQICAAHFKVTADSQPDANNLFAFAIIDNDGSGMACLEKHKSDACDNSHACVNLRDINPNARIDVADDLLDKAHVALHSGPISDTPPPVVPAATEAGTVCNCTAQVPGPGPQDTITKLMKDIGVDDSKSSKHDRSKKDNDDGDDNDKADKSDRPGHGSRDDHDRPDKSDKDKSGKDDDKEMADLDRQLAQLMGGKTGSTGMNSGMNQGMMMSSGMGSNNSMSNYYTQMMQQQQQQQMMQQMMMMNSMSGMNGMSSMNGMGSSNSMTSYYAQLMQQQQQQQMMQQMMMGSSMGGMSGLSGLTGLSGLSGYTNPLYSGITGNSILGTSLANTSAYGGSITGGSIGTTAASVYSPYTSLYSPYRFSTTGR